jgi:hypothetical protein
VDAEQLQPADLGVGENGAGADLRSVARNLLGCALMGLLCSSRAFGQWSVVFHTWYGTSKCTDRQHYPACTDEQVVYEIRAVHGKTDTISAIAEKIVKQKREFVADYRLVHVADSTWSTEIRAVRFHGRLTLRYSAQRFAGELIDLESNRRVRAIALTDESAIWRRRISAPESLVVKLYREMAGQAVIGNVELEPLDVFGQSREGMADYLDASLIGLVLADRQCSRTNGVCNLDFGPIWNSQDPTGTVIEVLTGPDSTRIGVQLRHTYDGKLDTLTYRMVKTRAGWRIHDIEYSDHTSLATMLRGKPPS